MRKSPCQTYSTGVERRGGRDDTLRWSKPGSGLHPMCVGTTAIALLGWGLACRRRGHSANWFAPITSVLEADNWAGGGAAWAAARAVWELWPSRCLVCAECGVGGCNVAPGLTKPRSGRDHPRVGVPQQLLLGWCCHADPREGKSGSGSDPMWVSWPLHYSGGRARRRSSPDEARPQLGPAPVCVGAMAAAVARSSRRSAGAERRRGGRNIDPPSELEVQLGSEPPLARG